MTSTVTTQTTKRNPDKNLVEYFVRELKKGTSKSQLIRTTYLQMSASGYDDNHRMGDIMRTLNEAGSPTLFQMVRNVLVAGKLR
jgi:hypothetical protein